MMKTTIIKYLKKTFFTFFLLLICYNVFNYGQSGIFNDSSSTITYNILIFISSYSALLISLRYLSFIKPFPFLFDLVITPIFLLLLIFPIILSLFRMVYGSLIVFIVTYFLLDKG